MKDARIRFRIVITLFLTSIMLMSAACNLPLDGLLDFAGGQGADTPTATPTLAPTATITPVPFGVLAAELLESLPTLATTMQRLQTMQVTRVADGAVLTGIDMLRGILIDQRYDPGSSYASKEELLSGLNDYEFPSRGQKIFLLSVAHGLALEVRNLVPWSIRDYSAQEINNLFIEDTALRITAPGLDRGTLPGDMPNLATHTHPMDGGIVEAAHVLQYQLASALTGDAATPSDAAAAITVWMQQSFFHANDAYSWDVYLDGREPRSGAGPSAYPLSLQRVYEERVVGCHEPSIMLEGMLHSLNIPALRLSVHGHGVVYLPTLDRYVHGDHIANYTASPPGVLLLTPGEFRPYAEDVAWIYQIFFDKFEPPIPSIPLMRDGDSLYIYARNVVNRPEMTCVEISLQDWTWLSTQLEAYDLFYDTVNCELTSDRVPILTLEALSAPVE